MEWEGGRGGRGPMNINSNTFLVWVILLLLHPVHHGDADGSPTVGEEPVASDGRQHMQQLCGCTRGYKNNKSPTSPYILISYGRRRGKEGPCVGKKQLHCNPCILGAFSGSNNISVAACIPAAEAGTRCSHALQSSLDSPQFASREIAQQPFSR